MKRILAVALGVLFTMALFMGPALASHSCDDPGTAGTVEACTQGDEVGDKLATTATDAKAVITTNMPLVLVGAGRETAGRCVMILDAILGWIASLAEAAMRLWPSWTPNFPDTSGLTGHLSEVNYFLPVQETFAVVVVILALAIPFFTVTLALWVVALIRGGSSRG